jgi:hypothetical protein
VLPATMRRADRVRPAELTGAAAEEAVRMAPREQREARAAQRALAASRALAARRARMERAARRAAAALTERAAQRAQAERRAPVVPRRVPDAARPQH